MFEGDRKQCDEGVADACHAVGYYYWHGLGTAVNHEYGFASYQKAYLGGMIEQGTPPEKMKFVFKTNCDLGHAKSCSSR